MLKKLVSLGLKKRVILNFVAFVVTKSAVFLAPLILSNYLSIPAYGNLEYGISLGNIFAMILGLGLSGSYPYFMLKKRETKSISSFLLYVLLLFSAGLIFILCFYLFGFDKENPYLWAVLFAILIAIQSFFSSIYKTHNRTIGAVFIDSGFYIYLILFAFAMILIYQKGLEYIYDGLVVYTLLLAIILIGFFKARFVFTKQVWQTLGKIIKHSYPMVITSFMIMLLSNSARILVENYFNEDALANYSFYFRIASGVVLFHQFASITYFKQLFISNSAKLDKYYSLFIFLLIIVSVSGFFLVPILFQNYFKLLANIVAYREIYFFMVVLVTFWIALALNEPLIYRENITTKFNISLGIILVLSGIGFFIYKASFNLELIDIVKFHFILLFFSLEAQYTLLKSKNLNLSKTRLLLRCIFFLTFIADYFLVK